MSDAFSDVLGDEDTPPPSKVRDDLTNEMGYEQGTRGRLIPFGYYGGKYKHLNWILPLLPENKAYVEPFGGSGVVLLNRQQSDVETLNDSYEEVSNFFQVLRESPDELIEKITLTPYSEDEFIKAQKSTDDNVEQARRFFVLATMSYNSIVGGSPQWGYAKAYSSRGVSKKVSAYQAKIRRLSTIAERLTDVQITNRDAVDVIETFDTADCLMYCDPPYPPSVRSGEAYVQEMDREDHIDLASTLIECEADIAISSYQSDLYDDLFLTNGWQRVDNEEQSITVTPESTDKDSTSRVESLYVNYEITDEMIQEAFGE